MPTGLPGGAPGSVFDAHLDGDAVQPKMAVVELIAGAVVDAQQSDVPPDLADEADGALLTYNADADLEGPVAIANNPIGEGITKNSLGTFFKNLEKAIV